MKVLLTGASGFLGGHIAEMLVEAGHEVRAFVRRTSRTGLLEKLGVGIARGDLLDRASLDEAMRGVEAVIHAAATMTGPAQEFEATSTKGSENVFDAAEKAGVKRFVHISSIAVLRMKKPARGEAIAEDTPYEDDPTFLGVYNKSKIDAERAVLGYGERSDVDVVVIRPGLLYGPRGKWVLPRMGYALGDNCFVVVGMGWNPLPVCYVRNCARAAVLAAQKEGLRCEAFNIVDDEPFTQVEYLKRLKREVRSNLSILRAPYLLARLFGVCAGMGMNLLGRGNPIAKAHLVACVRRLRYSNEKAKRCLGWEPIADKEQALSETMRDYADRERVSRRADLRALGKPSPGLPPVTSCIVGCGAIAESHLKILDKMPHARVLAVCDTNREAARELARRHRVLHTYDDAREMLETEKPQVVHILTPPQSHAALAELACELGCDALVEKPMAMNAEEARRMVECAARHGRRLCVDHNHLYDPVMVKARRLIESGAVGDIIWLDSYYGFDLGSNRNTRYMLPGGGDHWTFKIPGGLYQNLAPHPLSVALDVLGAPYRIGVQADASRVVPHQATDELRIFLDTPRGRGKVTVSLAASPRFQYLEVQGTRMRLKVDLLNKWIIRENVMRGIPKPISRAIINLRQAGALLRGTLSGMARVLLKKWTPYDGMALLISEFYSAAQSGRTPPVTGEEGAAVMEVMDAVWRELRTET